MDSMDEGRLNQCLTSAIAQIEEVLKQMQDKRETSLGSTSFNRTTTNQAAEAKTNVSSQDLLLENSVQNNNVNTFTVDRDEMELLDTLTNNIQNLLRDSLPQLSTQCSRYIEQHLHQYHYESDQRVFTEGLTANILYSLKHELNGVLLAAQAYPAALNGDLQLVEAFLKRYPVYKDKPGFWGTTLLYSAARNNHVCLVRHLIETLGCSVNAQNESEMAFALINDNDNRGSDPTLSYNPDPKFASTALHVACFNNNLETVKYLISKGANYFLRNQLGETPIQNGKHNPAIQDFFKDFLVPTYTATPNARLPTEPILDCHDRKPHNCIWEYKPVKGLEWEEFTMSEHHVLSAALTLEASSQSFDTTTYLSARQGTYNVSLLTFLRGGRNQEPNPSNQDSLAWIRCRGSSIANFGICCVWQLMFVKYDTNPQSKTEAPTLGARIFPSVYDSKFQIKQNSWYTCDSTRNALLDDAMNYRRRCIDINCNFEINHSLNKIVKCNLYTFTFANNDKTILGFIRWIPKIIANTSNDQKAIKVLDNFKMVSSFNPIPLTTKRLEEFISSKSATGISMTTTDDDENNVAELANNASTIENEADEGDDDGDNMYSDTATTNIGTWSLIELQSNDFQPITEEDEVSSSTTQSSSALDAVALGINDFFDQRMDKSLDPSEKIGISQVSETSNRSGQDNAAEKAKATLETQNQQLQVQIVLLQNQVEEQLRSLNEQDVASSVVLNTTMDRLDNLQNELHTKTAQEDLIKETAKQISTAEYTVPRSNQSVLLKFNLIINKLRNLNYPLQEYFKDSVPVMELDDQYDGKILLKGFLIHHRELNKILQCLQNLVQQIQSTEAYYNQRKRRNIQFLLRTLHRVHPKNLTHWKPYCSAFVKLMNQKYDDYVQKFKTYINNKLKTLVDSCIQNPAHQFREAIIETTNDYMKAETFSADVEFLKSNALDAFIHEHILLQQKSTKTVPTKESVLALNKHIDKIKTILKTSADYKGCELKHFYMVVSLLQRLMIFYHCFLAQLPLFNASVDLLGKLESNIVITIATATGSGKSTLLPALLAAEGYDKIIVTQPRRLPCNLISQRVNSMVNDDISGWAVSGAENNVQGKILYLTDGLLKERLLNDENLITENTKVTKSVIFFMDEVHERSINIDLCLALFARLLTLSPQLKTKMKLIISSATLDASVPALYRKIPGCSLSEFNLASLSTLYPVTFNRAPNENLLDLVQQLYAQRNRHDQILCFVGSTQDVHENCQLLKKLTKGAIVAYPLVQSQSAIDQQRYIEQGSVFISTTVAETSLTFPCLRYVIDTGVINMPVYSLELERTELQEIKSAESTTKQRLGRLGRTQPGEYYALYDYPPGQQRKYPVPQICQSELVNIEFALRRSRLKTNLREFQAYLPDKPKREYIDDAIKQLQRLELIDTSPNAHFTSLGATVAKLPDFSSLSMSKAVYAALKRYRCGRDLIVLSSILSVLNTSTTLKSIPAEYKRPEGDFMTLLQVMNTILLVRDSVPAKQFSLERVCTAKRLSAAAHIIKPALRRYKNLEKAFSLSEEFHELARVQSGNWENIAKALLKGFSNRVYASQKILQGKTQQYIKYNNSQRTSSTGQQDSLNEASAVAIIDRTSTLRTGYKGAVPASLVLARDVRYLTAIRSTAILSFVGQVESAWLEYTFTRELKLNEIEEKTLRNTNILQNAITQFAHAQIQINSSKLLLSGPSGHVLNAELYLRQQLVTPLHFTLASDQPNNPNANLTRNLKSITSMPGDLFGPLRWRWESENQVKIRTNMKKNNGTIDVTVEGLDSQNQAVRKEFMSFLSWLRTCAVIRDPNAGVSPRVLKPQIRDQFRDMEAKIANITDPDRTSVDKWKSLKGPNATRETRMEVVAWIAVCQYHCRLEGGFVRDWVVGNYSSKPANLPPDQWVSKSTAIPVLHRDLVPSDLDCHLPQSKKFDIEAFLDALHGYGITATSWRQDWRYVLLIDENAKTGPFTMDLIEPHIALTHDRIDFDVSNLSLEHGYTKDLGMRVDVTGGTYPIQLETIVENTRNKNFQVLRPIDGENGPNTSGTVAERIRKMESRGWKQVGTPFSFIPDPPKTYNAVLVPYPSTTLLYQNLVAEMQKIPGAHVISIEQIKNPDIEALYEYMKRTIAKECPGDDPRERELFHGTSGAAIQGIIDRGFDDRFFSPTGAWGRGAYFADDPRKSNGYAPADSSTNRRVILYNKVLLGTESAQTQPNNAISAAPQNHHSVHGTGFQYHEYIVYRYGQALPYLKITYTAP